MTRTAKITRFSPEGPNGLEVWEQMDYASLVSGEPVQRGHIYHEIESSGYMLGVWDCTAFTDRMMPYAVDEYMLFLEGDLTMVLPSGEEVEIHAGDAFIVPKGFECQWKQPGYVHKVFMILDGPVPEADNPSLKRITVPDLAAPPGDGTPLISTRTDFVNAAGTMSVDVQSFCEMRQPAMPVRENLLITVLEGALRLHDGEAEHSFGPGDTFYVQQGGTVGWTASAGTRVITARYAGAG